jgi:hypothetical protein
LRNVLDEVASLPRSKIKAKARPSTEAYWFDSTATEHGRSTMSAALTLPYVWAETPARVRQQSVPTYASTDGIAFYRKRTELLLRRYMFVSLQTGRVPSLIGKSVFRGKASSYRMHNFEDAVIFLFDIEKCLKKLDPFGQELIARIALQEYTQEETAQLVGHSVRSIVRKYAETIDALSRIFLDLGLMKID